MPFQWLEMRIGEERERRQREAEILDRLPQGLTELHRILSDCLASYTEAFGPESAEIHYSHGRIRITVRDQQGGKWEQRTRVDITGVFEPPGFKIDRGSDTHLVEVGPLPGEGLFYRLGEDYLTTEDLTRRILDPALFPKLAG